MKHQYVTWDITVPLSDLQAFNVRSIVFNDVSNTIPTCFALDTWVIGFIIQNNISSYRMFFQNCNNLLFAGENEKLHALL